MQSKPSSNRRGLIIALIFSIGLHVAVISVLLRTYLVSESPKKSSNQQMVMSFTVNQQSDLLKSGSKVDSLHELSKMQSADTTQSDGKGRVQSMLTHPKLNWIKELDLDSLDDHDGGGYVDLEILIGVDGNAIKIINVETDLPPFFTELLIAAFMEARFIPGMLDDMPVPAKFRIRTNFQ